MPINPSKATYWLNMMITIALLLSLVGCKRQNALYDPPTVYYPNMMVDDAGTGKPVPVLSPTEAHPKLTLVDMEAAIFEGCAKRHWIPVNMGGGVINATLHLRDHTAIVRISFTADRFTLKYLTSENLNYGIDEKGVAVIHPNYNAWIQNLKNDITLAVANQTRLKAKAH